MCKNWYKLLTSEHTFPASCCLVNCVLSHKCAPTACLLKSATPFKKLVIDGGVVIDTNKNDDDRDDLTDLWKKLGETVTELDIQGFNGEPWTYFLAQLPHFPNLKKLKLKSDEELGNFLYIDRDWNSVEGGRRFAIAEEIFARLQCGGDLRSLIPRGYLYLDPFNIPAINDIIDENIELIESIIIKHIGGDIVDASPFLQQNETLVNEVWEKVGQKLKRVKKEYPILTNIESMQFLYIESRDGEALEKISLKFPGLKEIGADVDLDCNDKFLQFLQRSKNLTLTAVPRLPLRNHTQIGELTRLLDLPNVKLSEVGIGEGDILDVVLKRQKSVKSTTLIHSNLPESHVNKITNLFLRLSSVQVKQLRRFEHFTSLRELTIILHDVQGDTLDTFSNSSVSTLELFFEPHMCSEWLDIFLSSFKALKSLSLKCNGMNANFMTAALETQSKIEKLTISRNLESQSNQKFVVGISSWPELPALKNLTINVPKLVDSDDELVQFFKKNIGLTGLVINLDKTRSGLKVFEIITGHLPRLKFLDFTVMHPTDWPNVDDIVEIKSSKGLWSLLISCIDFSNEIQIAKEQESAGGLIHQRLQRIFSELSALRYIKLEKPAVQFTQGDIWATNKSKAYLDALTQVFQFFSNH